MFQASELLNPKWNFDRVTAKPETKDPEEEDEDEGGDKPKPKPNPIRLQQRSQLSRPASREKEPAVEEGEEEPPRDGAPPGTVFLDINLEVGEIPVVEVPAIVDVIEDDE